jgi:hypothetical protein
MPATLAFKGRRPSVANREVTKLIGKIHGVEKSRNPLSAPTLSLNRIAIRDASGKLLALVSPQNRDVFIADLQARLPR